MKVNGTKVERETVILFNEEEDFATIFTASRRVYYEMLRNRWIPHKDNDHSAEFRVPKDSIRLPGKNRKATK